MPPLKMVWASLWSQKKQVWSALFALSLSVACLSSFFHIKKILSVELQTVAPIAMLNVNVSPAQNTHSTKPFSSHAYQAFAEQLPPEIQSAAYQHTSLLTQIKGVPIEAFVIGVDPALLSWMGFELKEGRAFTEEDKGQKVAIVGARIAERLKQAHTEHLSIQKQDVLSTIGTLESGASSSLWAYPIDDLILVPISTLPRLGVPLEGSSFMVQSQTLSLDALESALHTFFNNPLYHLWVQPPLDQKQWAFFEQLLSKMSIIIALILGALGFGLMAQLLNTWFHQRRYEIGLHMALGASPQQCIQWIAAHLLILAAMSAFIGSVISLFFTSLLAYILHWPLSFSALGLLAPLSPIAFVMLLIQLKSPIIKKIPPFQWLAEG